MPLCLWRAGARGAEAWLDIIAGKMFKGITVLGYLDSPYYIDVKAYDATFEGMTK
jgi:hypothetical protein